MQSMLPTQSLDVSSKLPSLTFELFELEKNCLCCLHRAPQTEQFSTDKQRSGFKDLTYKYRLLLQLPLVIFYVIIIIKDCSMDMNSKLSETQC
jgi:hypothetical protein